jgi:hypothetical protein
MSTESPGGSAAAGYHQPVHLTWPALSFFPQARIRLPPLRREAV